MTSNDESSSTPGEKSSKRKWILLGVAAVLAAVVGAIAYVILSDDAAPKPVLDDLSTIDVDGASATTTTDPPATTPDTDPAVTITAVTTSTTEVATSSTVAPPPDPGDGSPTGAWVVVPGEAGDDTTTFVGYRIEEVFASDTLKKEATGRTPAVEGGLVIDGSQVISAQFTADVTQLSSDSLRRDRYIEGHALETESFPEARFVLTEPIELGPIPAHDTPIEVSATGDLTLRDVTLPVVIDLTVQWNGTIIQVIGTTHIVLADFGIEPPDVLGTVTVDPEGELELKLNLVR